MSVDTWPPKEGLFTPTVARSDVTLPIFGSIIIDAPASVVWQVLLDTSKYHEWNKFVPEVDIHSQPDGSKSPTLQLDTSMTFIVRMDPAKMHSTSPTQLRVVDFSTPDAPSSYLSEDMLQDPVFTADQSRVYRISWKLEGGFVSRGLRSERFHEIIILDENRCEVRNWECMGGFLARTVKWTYGSTLPLRCREWLEGLKNESEKMAAGGK